MLLTCSVGQTVIKMNLPFLRRLKAKKDRCAKTLTNRQSPFLLQEAESISYGVSDKANQAEATSRSLYSDADNATYTVETDLEPKIAKAKNDVKMVGSGQHSRNSKSGIHEVLTRPSL